MQKNKVKTDRRDIVKIYLKKLSVYTLSETNIIGVYGTGVGAGIVFDILDELGLKGGVKAVIDNDEVVTSSLTFQGMEVHKLDEVLDIIDTIIISSMDYHEIVYARVIAQVNQFNKNIKIINLFGCNTNDEIREYVNYIEKTYHKQDLSEFVEFDDKSIILNDDDTKVIAWYLPQFHQLEINNKFYGRGFTEWTNTSTIQPMYVGHYQPHIPYDVGYYDLNNEETLYRQAELAKHYGVYGFSFYYYWFSGQRIMEMPLEKFLKHEDIDVKFCITWANENWSANWDGGNSDLIFEQRLHRQDDAKFIRELIPIFQDKRYIKIGGKPLLIIYRVEMWLKDRVRRLFETFRNETNRLGLEELYIAVCNTRGFEENVKEWGADALVEFPPNGIRCFTPSSRIDGYINPFFNGQIKSTYDLIKTRKYLYKHNNNSMYFRGVFPSWDNTARKAYSGAEIFEGLNPTTFQQWLTDIIKESKIVHSKEEDIVFINAWNEWAEGAHLEPDCRYGYANLAAVKKSIEESRS